jgi:hypothetical protein
MKILFNLLNIFSKYNNLKLKECINKQNELKEKRDFPYIKGYLTKKLVVKFE